MSSLRRRIGTVYWFACFTDANGRRIQRSTKTTDRKLAAKLAAEWEGVAHRRATEAQTRRVLSDLHEQIHGTPLALFTVKAYAEQWLARKQVETRAVSFSAYKSAIDGFRAFLGDKQLQSIAEDALAARATAQAEAKDTERKSEIRSAASELSGLQLATVVHRLDALDASRAKNTTTAPAPSSAPSSCLSAAFPHITMRGYA